MAGITLEEMIHREAEQQLAVQRKRKPERPKTKKSWIPFALDVVIAGVLVCVFALFHHVLPTAFGPSQDVLPPSGDNPTINVGKPDEPEDTVKPPFTKDVVVTENSYSSENIAITIEQRTKGEGNNRITYYVADIRLKSVDCFRTAFAKDKFAQNTLEDVVSMADRHNAILATAGDFYGWNPGRTVIRNGTAYRDGTSDSDVCVLYRDGSMKIFYKGQPFNAHNEVENGAWQAWSFGPSLFDKEGEPITAYPAYKYIEGKHPRCALGYYEPGHYVFVLIDGRDEGYSDGMTIGETSALMKELGCTVAYNLDGGRSAQMVFNGEMHNQPYKDGRKTSDILYIGEPITDEEAEKP